MSTYLLRMCGLGLSFLVSLHAMEPTTCDSFLDLLPSNIMEQVSAYLPENQQIFYLKPQEHEKLNNKICLLTTQQIADPGKNLITIKDCPQKGMTSFADNETFTYIKNGMPTYDKDLTNLQIYDNKTGKRIDSQIQPHVKAITLNPTTTAYIDFKNHTCTLHNAAENDANPIIHLKDGSIESQLKTIGGSPDAHTSSLALSLDDIKILLQDQYLDIIDTSTDGKFILIKRVKAYKRDDLTHDSYTTYKLVYLLYDIEALQEHPEKPICSFDSSIIPTFSSKGFFIIASDPAYKRPGIYETQTGTLLRILVSDKRSIINIYDEEKTALVYDKSTGYLIKKSLSVVPYIAPLTNLQRTVLAQKLQQNDQLGCISFFSYIKKKLTKQTPDEINKEKIYETLPDLIKRVIND